MINIDIDVLKSFYQNDLMKNVSAIEKPELTKEFIKYLNLNNKILTDESAYEVSSIINGFWNWYRNKNKNPINFPVKSRDVFLVDLGTYNLKYEAGYFHPCVVIKKYGTMVLVLPGSSKKYGKRSFLIENVTTDDGFKENTGLQIDQLRFVSIQRIVGSKVGELSIDKFKTIEEKMLKAYFENYFNMNEKMINDLKVENENLLKEVKNLNKENEKLSKEVKNLNKE